MSDNVNISYENSNNYDAMYITGKIGIIGINNWNYRNLQDSGYNALLHRVTHPNFDPVFEQNQESSIRNSVRYLSVFGFRKRAKSFHIRCNHRCNMLHYGTVLE